MSVQSEFSSFKLLLKQVYSAHTTKVKELENEVKTLKEKLIEKESFRVSNTTVADCKRCIELEEAFKSCKNALHEQSKMFENFGHKFSIFNNQELSCPDLKSYAVSPPVPDTVKASNTKCNVTQCDRNELCSVSFGDTITESKINAAEKLPLVSNNQNFLKNVMQSNGNLESFDVLTVTFPENVKHNVELDSLILAPDSLDVSDKSLRHLTQKKSPNANGSDILSDYENNSANKVFGKRPSTDSLNEDRIKRYNTGNQIESCSKVTKIKDANDSTKRFSKASRTKDTNNDIEKCSQLSRTKCENIPDVVPEIIITSNAAEIAKNAAVKSKMSLKDSNKQNAQVSKKNLVSTEVSKDHQFETPKSSVTPLVNDLKKKATSSEISPSLLPITANGLSKLIDLEAISDDNDDFQEKTSSSKSVPTEDSWEICDKKKAMKKNKNPKSIKTTSKYKMTLDAPPLNYKKTNYKQTKLSKSIFKVIDANKKPSVNLVSSPDVDIIISEDDSSPTIQTNLFRTSTQYPNKSVDIDATFIPDNFRLDSPDFVTSNVKKNTVEKSNFKNGNSLFSNINFTEELKSTAKDDAGNINEINDHALSKDAELKENMNSYDRIPMPEEPNYKYKNEVVRKKAERKQLNAFDCKECEKYYSDLGLSDKEKKERMKKCSRHRAKFTPPSTPDHFWELDFPDTEECKARGYMNATQKVKLHNIYNL